MTKTQISVRVSPDTLATIDAQAERLGISRGALIDRWLAAQAQVAAKSEINRDASILSAIMLITDAIDVLAK